MDTFEQATNRRAHDTSLEVTLWTAGENSKKAGAKKKEVISKGESLEGADATILNDQGRLLLINEMSSYRDAIKHSPLLQHPNFQQYYDSASIVLQATEQRKSIEKFGKEQRAYQMERLDNAIKGYALLAFVQDQRRNGNHIQDEFTNKWELTHDESRNDGFKSPEARAAYYEFRAVVARYDPCRNPIEKELVYAYLRADKCRRDFPIGKYVLLQVLFVTCGVRHNFHNLICKLNHPKRENVFVSIPRKTNRKISYIAHKPQKPLDSFPTALAPAA